MFISQLLSITRDKAGAVCFAAIISTVINTTSCGPYAKCQKNVITGDIIKIITHVPIFVVTCSGKLILHQD